MKNVPPQSSLAGQPSGASGAAGNHSSTATGIVGRPTGERVPLQEELFEHGRAAARRAGQTDPNPETVKALEDHAASAADCLGAAAYEPATNAADRLQQDAYEDALARREKFRQEHDHAQAALRDREIELATIGGEPEQPASPILVGLLGVTGMAISLMFTLNDLVFTKMFVAKEQSLMAAFLCSAIIAGLVTWGMLSSAQHERQRHTDTWLVGLALAFGAGLLLLRLGGATSTHDRLVAYGFTALEVVATLVVKVYTVGLRARWQSFRIAFASWETARERVTAAAGNVGRIEGRLADTEGRIGQHLSDVRLRGDKVRSAPLLREAARAAVLAGYQYGLAENRGHLHGFAERLEGREELTARL